MAKTSMKLKQARTPKFSTRAYTRCRLCGRPHSVLRKYGVCRICFRELAYKGEIPGVRKASWYSGRETEGGTNMVVNDPIADMLTRIRNAQVAKHEAVTLPASNTKKAIAKILLAEGYVKAVDYIDDGLQGSIKVTLKYINGKTPVIAGLKRISKPGLRVYARCEELPKVLGGLGIAIISTSKGLMTDKEARKNAIGGEVLAYIW